MKKLTCLILLTATVLFAFASCGKESPKEEGKLRVGLVQLIDNGAFTDMREGFIARLRELGYTEDKLEIIHKDAQGDASSLNTICQQMASDGVDAVATIGTPATQAMVNLDSGIPVFYIAVSNPLAAKVITTPDTPDLNATGTSNAIPVDEMFALSDLLTPGCERYGFIYNTGEVNAVSTVEAAKAYLDAHGLTYTEKVVTASSEVQQAAQSLVGDIDAFFLPNDSMVQSAMPQIAQVARDAKLPVYGSSAVMVADGALATVSIDDTRIGAITADMLDSYLKGTPVTGIPAVTVSEFTTVINRETADAIGADIPQDILETAVIL